MSGFHFKFNSARSLLKNIHFYCLVVDDSAIIRTGKRKPVSKCDFRLPNSYKQIEKLTANTVQPLLFLRRVTMSKPMIRRLIYTPASDFVRHYTAPDLWTVKAPPLANRALTPYFFPVLPRSLDNSFLHRTSPTRIRYNGNFTAEFVFVTKFYDLYRELPPC